LSWAARKKIVEELALVLLKVKALQFGTFTLSSGKLSSYYIDLRAVPSFPGAYKACVDAYTEIAQNSVGFKKFDAVAGIPTAGLVFSSPLALALKKPMLYVREEEKTHGSQKIVEGAVVPGWRVLIIDDVVTTGSSIGRSTDALREDGLEVGDAAVLIDRMEGAETNLRRKNIRLHSLTNILELSDLLHSKELISKDEMKAILRQIKGR
jgi:orotate phosphoribosyltransferase